MGSIEQPYWALTGTSVGLQSLLPSAIPYAELAYKRLLGEYYLTYKALGSLGLIPTLQKQLPSRPGTLKVKQENQEVRIVKENHLLQQYTLSSCPGTGCHT